MSLKLCLGVDRNMQFALWSAIVGLLLVSMALSDSVLARLPLSTSMLYLAAGAALSPLWLNLAAPSPVDHAVLLEHAAEGVVLLSLFSSGLKMSIGLGDGRWLLPVRLAVGSMLLTVMAVAAAGVWLLGLPLGAAVLLGGILAPTDPVLASDVNVADHADRDKLRFSLTGEAGLNDGSAFPVVMLGLGLLGLHDIGAFGWRWLAVDVVWATACGLGVGAALGSGVGKLVLYLRRTHREATGLDNFLALGLIGLAYGITLLLHGYGFLAVFAAGVALRRVERQATSQARDAQGGDEAHGKDGVAAPRSAAPDGVIEAAHADPDTTRAEALATHPHHAPAYMAHAMLSFNEQLERIGEMAVVMVVGLLLWAVEWRHAQWGFVALLLLGIRPLSVRLGLLRTKTSVSQRRLIGWFGIRGIGSLYYLAYAANHGLERGLLDVLTAVTLSVVVASVVAHGLSVTPLMAFYERSQRRLRRGKA